METAFNGRQQLADAAARPGVQKPSVRSSSSCSLDGSVSTHGQELGHLNNHHSGGGSNRAHGPTRPLLATVEDFSGAWNGGWGVVPALPCSYQQRLDGTGGRSSRASGRSKLEKRYWPPWRRRQRLLKGDLSPLGLGMLPSEAGLASWPEEAWKEAGQLWLAGDLSAGKALGHPGRSMSGQGPAGATSLASPPLPPGGQLNSARARRNRREGWPENPGEAGPLAACCRGRLEERES